MCYIEPLNSKDPLSRNGPFYQHIILRVVKHYLKDLSNFDKSNPSYSFVSNLTWKLFFRVRAFVQSYNIIELSELEELEDPEGIMITVSCRPKDHDLIVIFVPNIPLFGSEPYFYAEYLTTLHSLLLLQGFHSPAVFIMKFPEICKESSMEINSKYFIEFWIKFVEKHHNSKIILMGDSFGATLILNFLSIKHSVFFSDEISKNLSNSFVNVDPYAVILISPIVNFDISKEQNTDNTGRSDYFSNSNINDVASFFCSDTSFDKYNPIKWQSKDAWDKIVPDGGMVVTFGDQELQSKEIEMMCQVAFETNRVKIIKGKNKGHVWQFVSFLTEETQDEKEDSCFMLAGIISRLALFQTLSYRDPERAFEPLNILTIDDDHL